MKTLLNWVFYILWKISKRVHPIWNLLVLSSYFERVCLLIIVILGTIGIEVVTVHIWYLIYGKIFVHSMIWFFAGVVVLGAWCPVIETKLSKYKENNKERIRKLTIEIKELERKREEFKKEQKTKQQNRKLWL